MKAPVEGNRSATARGWSWVLLVMILAGTGTLAGCWDRTEVNDLAIITAASIDRAEQGNVEVSVQVFISSSGQQGISQSGGSGGPNAMNKTTVRSEKGITVADAVSKLQEKLPRKIFWGHTEVFIFGEEAARAGIGKHIDYLLRHPQPREHSFLFISKGKAKELLSLMPPLERNLAEELREIARSRVQMEVTLRDVAEMLTAESGATAVPWIEPLPPEPGQTAKQKPAYILGTAVFKKDEMIGRLDAALTRGALFLRDEIHTATVTVPLERRDGSVSVEIIKNHTELIPVIRDNRWSLTVRMKAQSNVIQNTSTLDMNSLDVVRKLESKLNESLENRVTETLNRVQKEMKADILQFGDVFRIRYPAEYHKVKGRWDELFPQISVNVKAEVKVLRPGLNTIGRKIQSKSKR